MDNQANAALRRRKCRMHDRLVDRMMRFKLASPESFNILCNNWVQEPAWEKAVCKFFGGGHSRSFLKRLHRVARGTTEPPVSRIYVSPVLSVWDALTAEINSAMGVPNAEIADL